MNLDTILGLTAAAVSAAVLAAHYWRHWPEDVRAVEPILDETAETVEFTTAADEAIALTLPDVAEPAVWDDLMRSLPLNEAIWLMPNALGNEVEAWLSERAS